MESFEFKKVSPNNKEYQEHHSITQKLYEEDNYRHLYGGELINLNDRIADIEKMLSRMPSDFTAYKYVQETLTKNKENRIKFLDEYISELKKGIFVENPTARQINLQNAFLIKDIFNSEILSKKLEKIYADELKKTRNLKKEAVLQAIFGGRFLFDEYRMVISKNPSKMDEKLLELITQERYTLFKKREQYFQEKKGSWESIFIKRFEQFTKKYSIDTNTEDKIEYLKQATIGSVDPLIQKLEKTGGRYLKEEHKIAIGYAKDHEDAEYVYNHEALHAISGRTIVSTLYTSEIDKDYDNTNYDQLRIGIHFNNGILRWLNEAITEKINIEMYREENNTKILEKNVSIYSEEKELFAMLLNSGKLDLSEKDFYQAYFEDYNPKDTKPVTYWKNLFKKIQESYDPTFLQRLDKRIKLEGIEKVLTEVKEKGMGTI